MLLFQGTALLELEAGMSRVSFQTETLVAAEAGDPFGPSLAELSDTLQLY